MCWRKWVQILSVGVLFLCSYLEVSAQELNISDYVPVNHVALDYQGNGERFYRATLLLEYRPDENGVYQITRYNQSNEAITYIYQITNDGLYELATFNNVEFVSDLRYTAEAMDDRKSLILPAIVKANMTYRSGYDNEIQRTIESLADNCTLDEFDYQNIVRVKEERNVEGISVVTYHYYAQNLGEILVIDSEGSPIEMLLSTQ